MEKKNYYTIAALAKAFGIIETMACKGQWKLKELADMSKLPKGTLQRILLTLCELGYVQQSREGGEYSLTMKFFRLGQRISENVGLVDKVHPLCRQQQYQHGEADAVRPSGLPHEVKEHAV